MLDDKRCPSGEYRIPKNKNKILTSTVSPGFLLNTVKMNILFVIVLV